MKIRLWLLASFSLAVLLVAGFFFTISRAQSIPGERVIAEERQGDAVRQVVGSNVDQVQAPQAGFIDTQSPYCYQPDPAKNACFINFAYQYWDAAPAYVTYFTVTLDTKVRAKFGGFFQTSIYTSYGMFGQGLQVPCGAQGDGGSPRMGAAYSIQIRGRDTANLGAANYLSVYCPYYP